MRHRRDKHISNQAIVLVNVPYPPFGLITVSFFGLASFLMFNGIYSSAIFVAEDSELRKSIRRYAIEESRLLDSIGMAQMERSEEHTSELQSHVNLVCRLLLEKKKK